MKIEKMGLSVRAYNCLKENEIYTMQDLMKISEKELIKFKNLGIKTLNEVLAVRKKYAVFEFQEKSDFIESKNKYLGDFYQELEKLKEIIFDIILKNKGLISNSQINDKIFERLYETKIFQIILDSLITENKIEKIENNYRVYLPKLEDYINSLSENKKMIFINRLKGKTLEEIGKSMGVTRERIRQIEKRLYEKIGKVREDDYKEVFEKYYWHREEFIHIFSTSEMIYNFLKTKYKKGKENLENILFDTEISEELRNKAEKVIYKDFINEKGTRIKKDRNSILDYLLRTYCENDTTIEELEEIYKRFLESHNMINQEKFGFSERYLENRVVEKSTVLYKKGRKIRYYGKIEQSPENIIKELDFDKFKNLEISTLKLFTDYPEKMSEWDIRDEYELHNFLKKILKDYEKIDLSFGKMPTLKFGNPNREMQMLDLLIELAPVSLDELISAYEEKYGVKKETVLANYVGCISEYLQDGVYSIEYTDLAWEEQQYLRRELMEDVYYIDEIKEIYLNRFPNKDSSIINSYNLKKLGYKIYYNMVLSNKYNNLEQYYKKVLKSKDIMDLNYEYIKGRHTPSFYRVFNILKNKFEIFEYLPNKIISLQKLNDYGIELNDLKEYVENVHNFNAEEIFTIKSLKKQGFKDKIEDLGFEEWFYASVLSSDVGFKFRKTNNTILFGKEKVTVGDFVKYVTVNNTGIDIYNLQDYLFQYYGIKIEKHKLIENIKEKNLYYDQVMEKVYIDYNKYLEMN